MNLKPIAQTEAWNTLKKISSALPQATVLIGPSGVGKKRTARALYQWLHCTSRDQNLSSEACGSCSSCRKIAEDKHADFIEIRAQGEQILVDDLREMKKMLFFPPMDGKLRFILIDDAHKLNASSANSLLKTLEEPPAHTRFFLVTHERGLLLPTIVSRCQFVHFAPLDEQTLLQLLKEQQLEVSQTLWTLCLDLLGGGLERAALFRDEKVLSFLQSVQTSIEDGSSNWQQIVETAEQLAGTDQWKLELFLDLLTRIGHRRAFENAENKNLAAAVHEANRALDAVYLRRRLARNANKKLVGLAAAGLSSHD